jgi:hypothetical protein
LFHLFYEKGKILRAINLEDTINVDKKRSYVLFIQRSVDSMDEQLTTTGEMGLIFNGLPDWVFEVLTTTSFFSSHSPSLLTFNSVNVAAEGQI